MERHPYFDLWLHPTAELALLLGCEIIERTTLHEWPLSCVQMIRLDDGRRWIYKCQFHEGVEARFYECVRSPLLTGYRQLGEYDRTVSMFLEFIPAPRLCDLGLSQVEILDHGRRILAQIRDLEPGAPVYQDLGTWPLWQAYTADTLAKLDMLIGTGVFRLTRSPVLKDLARWAASPDLQQGIQSDPGLLHADLSGDNIFLTPDGYRVIDWQYPRRGPAGVDWACYLDGMGLDPLAYVPRAAVQVFWFIRLNWFVECKTRLFPPGEVYDRQVAALAERILA